ncbi:MAG: STAS domain-containing protein, partial [Armatimonadota bacterium]|nr:STAS domain-containing protein [Armatimonadota bacterium]
MELTTGKAGDVPVITIGSDHLDAGNADEFKQKLAPLIADSSTVLLDMSQVQFLDSAGLGALLSGLRRLSAAGGDLRLFGLSRQVHGVFQATRMHRIFDLFD